jgi:Zn-finger nucleic acid-binding protein
VKSGNISAAVPRWKGIGLSRCVSHVDMKGMPGLEKPRITSFNCPNCGASVAPDSPSCTYCGSAIAVQICPSCFGSVSVGMRHCPHCGTEIAGLGSEETTLLKCPRCATGLRLANAGKRSLNVCDRCGGLWVDKETFQEICVQQADQEAVLGLQIEPQASAGTGGQKPRRAYIPCPQCGKLMNQKNFSGCSGVVLDWCRDHGSWFDRLELQQIVAFIQSGGLRKAREQEESRLKERESNLRIQEMETALRDSRIDPGYGSAINHPKNDDSLLQLFSRMLLH